MKQQNVLDLLFENRSQERLTEPDDEETKNLGNKISKTEECIDKFINKRIHPKSRKKLRNLIENYIILLETNNYETNRILYKKGVSDGLYIALYGKCEK